MARRYSWSEVRGGALAAAALALVAFAVLRYARVGALRGDTIRVYALTDQARGLLVGSEVWLSGQKVGRVSAIRFRDPSIADTLSRLELELEVLDVHRTAMRRDANAQVRAGGSFVGAPVVYLTPGSARAAVIRDGDTVRTRAQADLEGAASQFGMASREFPAIISNVRLLASQLQGTGGTVGAVLNGPESGELARAGAQVSQLRNRLTNGRGTAALVLRGELQARVGRVMARVDTVRALLASPNTSLGRFRRDSTLMAEVADIRNELALVQRQLDEPRGTAGRVVRDSAITLALAGAQREMALLFADIKAHPLRYIKF